MTKLDVITGFLGAGKTSLLTRYTRWLMAQGVRYCIIENEFGRAGVDGALLQSIGARVKEISGGCVCCTLKVGLHDLLRELSGEVERILLEPSGLFCGDDLMDILQSPDCAVEPGMWVGLLDPLALPVMNEEDRAVLQSELMYAGSIVVSKTQYADSAEKNDALRHLSTLLPAPSPVVWAQPWDTLTDELWFPAMQTAGMVTRPHERRRFDHAAMFQSASFAPSARFEEAPLRACLKTLMGGSAGAVLRVKGTLHADDGVWRINGTPGCEEVVRVHDSAQPMLKEPLIKSSARGRDEFAVDAKCNHRRFTGGKSR